jgi:hypothetical protein
MEIMGADYEFKVLMALLCHADEFGRCYPGVDRIRKVAHISEGNARRGIDGLLGRGWIRRRETRNPLRGTVQVDYQISPYVIALRPECTEFALKSWRNVFCEGQPPLTTISNHHHEPTSLTTTTNHPGFESGEDTLSDSGELMVVGEGQDQNREDHISRYGDDGAYSQTKPKSTGQKTSQNRKSKPSTSPPDSAPPPQAKRDNSSAYHKALFDREAEKLAQWLRDHWKAELSAARGLVVEHGVKAVQVGVNQIRRDMRDGQAIHNPYGILVHRFRAGKVNLADVPSRNEYMGNFEIYAEIIQS